MSSRADVLKRVPSSLLGIVLIAFGATLLSPGTASASNITATNGFAVVCADGDYAVDGWLGGNFVGKVQPGGNCQTLEGPPFAVVTLYVDNASPGIFLRNVELSPDHITTVRCGGTPENPTGC